MPRPLLTATALAIATALTGCESAPDPTPSDEMTFTEPGLSVGEVAPDVSMVNIDRERVQLAEYWADGPVVITFYRGGWCPYCIGALKGWESRLDDIERAGGAFIAITPEHPLEVQETMDKGGFDFTILTDVSGDAARRFRVSFELSDDTKKRYKGFGIDLATHNANQEWELPAPATFVVDRNGVVRYAFADWAYKTKDRADPDEAIAVLKAIN